MKYFITTLAAISLSALVAFGQTDSENAASVDKLRTESGIDPTRVTSRIGYSYMFFDKEAANMQTQNRIVANLGVNRWSFQVKADVVSTNTTPTGRFTTGFGDLKFTILNAFYVKGRSALAGAVEFALPTASQSIGAYTGMGGYVLATPSLTYSYTATPNLMLAIQPQFTFALAKSHMYPDVNTLTVRIFAAYFAKSGYFFVLEPRPIYDFSSKNFDLVISPIIGKAIGGGYNVIALAEIPTNSANMKSKGALYQLGISKTF